MSEGEAGSPFRDPQDPRFHRSEEEEPTPPDERFGPAPVPRRFRYGKKSVPPAMHIFFLDLGKVLSLSFSIFFKNIFTFVVLSFLVYAPIFVAGGLFYTDRDVDMQQHTIFGYFVSVADNLLLYWVLSAAMVYGVNEQLRGRRPRVGPCLKNAFSRIGPVILLGILTLICYAGGAVLCIFPAFILMCIWYVAFPVCVVERPGIIESLRRSNHLTKGHRWAIFGLFVIVITIAGGVSVLVLAPLSFATAGDMNYGILFWVTQALGLLTRSFGALVPAVVYHELRIGKEGADLEELASVFD